MELMEFTENLIAYLHKARDVIHRMDGLLLFNFVHIVYLMLAQVVQHGTLLQKLALTSVIMCSFFVIPVSVFGALVFRKFRRRRYLDETPPVFSETPPVFG